MFCNQCEQAKNNKGCTDRGVCGKDHRVASLQDLLTHSLKGLALWAREARRVGVVDAEADHFAALAHFSVLTNTNYDPERFRGFIESAAALRRKLAQAVTAAGGRTSFDDPSAAFEPAADLDGLVRQGEQVGLFTDHEADADIQSLQEIMVYGVRGIAAYVHHADLLGQRDESVYGFLHEAIGSLTDRSLKLEDWLGLVLKTGEVNLRAMELLDAGNTGTYGHPVPTKVPLGHKAGKAIAVSGHDLRDIEELLKKSEGRGIYVYTHGEVLATHGYPGLNKYPHFYGHIGTAWQNQRKEFPDFPGAILMTTNCLMEPTEAYKDRIFTSGPAGWPGVRHLEPGKLDAVVERAIQLPGYPSDEDRGAITVGFMRNAVLGVADKIVEAVKSGAIRHFFLVGGCDGAKPGRSYYRDFVQKTPKDTMILTLACGKYRFRDLEAELGTIGGFPRLLDVGQCNDAYSAVQIAVGLAKAFNCGVNELPLSFVLSWYEQKAVAILLTLLHLGVRNIRLGPSLPAFVTPNVLNVLVQKFNIMPIRSAEEDLKAILGSG